MGLLSIIQRLSASADFDERVSALEDAFRALPGGLFFSAESLAPAVVPSVGETISLAVSNASWMQIGQTLQVGSGEVNFIGGFFEVRSVSEESVVLRLLASDQNSPPGTILPTGSKVTIGSPLNRINGIVTSVEGFSWHQAKGEGWLPSPNSRNLTAEFVGVGGTLLATRTLRVELDTTTGEITVPPQGETVNGIKYDVFGGGRNKTITFTYLSAVQASVQIHSLRDGETGEKGDTGSQGPTGLQGLPGPNAIPSTALSGNALGEPPTPYTILFHTGIGQLILYHSNDPWSSTVGQRWALAGGAGSVITVHSTLPLGTVSDFATGEFNTILGRYPGYEVWSSAQGKALVAAAPSEDWNAFTSDKKTSGSTFGESQLVLTEAQCGLRGHGHAVLIAPHNVREHIALDRGLAMAGNTPGNYQASSAQSQPLVQSVSGANAQEAHNNVPPSVGVWVLRRREPPP